MLLEPYGFRWLRETWLKVDLGVEFYNTQPMHVDAAFALESRGVCAVRVAGRGGGGPAFRAHVPCGAARGAAARHDRGRGAGRRQWRLAPCETLPAMRMQPPGFLRGIADGRAVRGPLVAVAPGRLLVRAVCRAAGDRARRSWPRAPFNTPLLLTPGTLAMGLMNTLTLLVSLLLLFFAVDALERERSTGLAPIYYAAGVPTSVDPVRQDPGHGGAGRDDPARRPWPPAS